MKHKNYIMAGLLFLLLFIYFLLLIVKKVVSSCFFLGHQVLRIIKEKNNKAFT